MKSLYLMQKEKKSISIPHWCNQNYQRQSPPLRQNEFQSHIGAIRINFVTPFPVSLKINFNPTLVQLELPQLRAKNISFLKFQSHIGAIRIPLDFAIAFGFTDFNPTLVQLELRATRTASRQYRLISIPHWCNQNFPFHALPPTPFTYFNPTLVQLESLTMFQQGRQYLISIPHWCNQNLKFERKLVLKSKFQSHIGAIRIHQKIQRTFHRSKFQSHIGAIRISRWEYVQLEASNFNPTLVQLEWFNGRRICLFVCISIPHWCNQNTFRYYLS